MDQKDNGEDEPCKSYIFFMFHIASIIQTTFPLHYSALGEKLFYKEVSRVPIPVPPPKYILI